MKKVLQLRRDLSILKERFDSYRIRKQCEKELKTRLGVQSIAECIKRKYEQRSIKKGFYGKERISRSRVSWHR